MAKPPAFPSPAHARADALLAQLSEVRGQQQEVERRLAAALKRLKAAYATELTPIKTAAEVAHKKLLRLIRQERAAFFQRPGDLLHLPHGVLLFSVQEHVVRAKGVLAALSAQGFEEAIITEKSVNWAVLEGWPDERLLLVGASRTRKEVFSYELAPGKEAKDGER